MTPTVRLGRIRGIPVGAHWSVFVTFALVADLLASSVLPAFAKGASASARWEAALVVAVAFFASLLAHEVAHALMARRAGVEVKSITLWMLGGVTSLDGEPTSARWDLRIAVIGPVVSLACGVLAALGALALHLVSAPRVLVAAVGWLAVTNGFLAVFNLLPGAPLDGGRVLRAIVWRRTGDRDRADLAATRGGRMTGLFLIWLGVTEVLFTGDLAGGLWLVLIGWFLVSAATAERQQSVSNHALEGLVVDDVMRTDFTYLPAYQDLAAAARRAVETDDDYFPVCDFAGKLVGVVGVDVIVQALTSRPNGLTVQSVAIAVTPEMTARPGEPLAPALRRAGPLGVLAVLDAGSLVGLVTPRLVHRALRRGLVAAGTFDPGLLAAGRSA